MYFRKILLFCFMFKVTESHNNGGEKTLVNIHYTSCCTIHLIMWNLNDIDWQENQKHDTLHEKQSVIGRLFNSNFGTKLDKTM